MKDAIKIKPDKRYIAILSLKSAAAYLAGLLIVLFFMRSSDPWGFAGSSLAAFLTVFFVFFYPKSIYVGDESISFVKENDCFRRRLEFASIMNVEVTTKPYNTVTITTLGGTTYRLHPYDPQPFIDMF